MNSTPMDLLSFYASQGVMTSPGKLGYLFDDLPDDLPSLCKTVQGLLLHPALTHLYEVQLTSRQRHEVQIRMVSEMLERIYQMDNRLLNEARQPVERLVGNCRDHAVLFCAMLRHKRIPARVRQGFARYLSAELIQDHWVVEVWSPERDRWLLIDPQIDDRQRQYMQIQADTLDLKPDEFYTAARTWQLCRAGQAKSGNFGHSSKLRGWGFIRASLIQDLAALNKVEVLPWDVWWDLAIKPDEQVTPEEKILLDNLARLAANPDENFSELCRAYEDDPRFYLPTESKLKLLKHSEAARRSEIEGYLPGPLSRLAELSQRVATPPDPGIVQSKRKDRLPAGDPAMIVVRGARQHNLKNIDLAIPRNKLVVFTGVSGSGKSSLAFDTLYAEGQRRYVESLSTYVRRYLDQMDKPKVDYIGGLSPALAIEQKSISHNPRSTVATVTEVMDYLRMLFSRAGLQHCPECRRTIEPASAQRAADLLGALPPGARFQLLAPLHASARANLKKTLDQARQDGFSRTRINGQEFNLTSSNELPIGMPETPHQIELLIDRLVVPLPGDPDITAFQNRLVDSVETTFQAGGGMMLVSLLDLNGLPVEELLLSQANICPDCGISLPRLTASRFSFNSPSGMCPDCNGLGSRLEVDPNLIVEHPERSLLDGASRWYGNLRKKNGRSWLENLYSLAEHYAVDLELPWQGLPQSFRDVILFGSGDEKIHFTVEVEGQDSTWKGENVRVVRGLVYHINRLFRQTHSEGTRRFYASFMSQHPCTTCGGTRLCAEARHVTVGGRTFPQVLEMTVAQALDWINELGHLEASSTALSAEALEVVGEVIKELHDRLQFMRDVGLYYLRLDRPAPSLSGGEGQRIRLSSQLGCGLVGVMYILDEPSIGLHARDQRSLIGTLKDLRDLGNSVLVVEHDAETMLAADWLVDLGPGAGVLGGEVIAAGTPAEVIANPQSLTGRYLSRDLRVGNKHNGRRTPSGWLVLSGARLFNLKNITAQIPLEVFTCVTGVSGSGKSSLIADTLFPALAYHLNGAQTNPGPYDNLEGIEQLDKVISITQDPIGRTPRSNPATYTGVFDEIRRVFAGTSEARQRGYRADRFSFNIKGGRCEACQGHGKKKVEMHFLPDVWITCQECKGLRYNRQTLEVTYKGKNIADVLAMDVQEALEFFANHAAIASALRTLHEVGLDYVKLGQSATTLSGGEAQRIKLAKELSRAATGRTIYILDEPTTGLHFADIQRLLDVLHRLVQAGNSVVVIEHNLDILRNADWLIDLGPEGGASGGYILAEGTPEQVAQVEASFTGQFLRQVLQ